MSYSKGNWEIGHFGSCVVTDNGEELPHETGHDETGYYGGYLIAESIAKNDDAKLIAAAPDLLRALINVRKQMLKNGITYDNAVIFNEVDKAIKKAIEYNNTLL